MTSSNQSLFTRDDTIFGVCEGLGQDLGINANILRIAFAVSLIGNPLISLGAYAGAGVLVAVSRWLYPARASVAAEPAASVAPKSVRPLTSDNDAREMAFADAA